MGEQDLKVTIGQFLEVIKAAIERHVNNGTDCSEEQRLKSMKSLNELIPKIEKKIDELGKDTPLVVKNTNKIWK